MKRKMYILFNLSPSGIEGCKVRYDKEKGLYIENKLTKQWALYYSHDLKEKRDDLVEFFTELKGETDEKIHAIFSLHPSWLLMKRVKLPPAGKKEIRQFLTLQVERDVSVVGKTGVVWDYTLSKNEEEAVVCVCKTSTLAPVEKALKDCNLIPLSATVSTLSTFYYVKDKEPMSSNENCVLLMLEDDEASCCEVRNGEVRDLFWMSLGTHSVASKDRLSMLLFKLAERGIGKDIKKIIVTGSAEVSDEVRVSLSSFGTVFALHPDHTLPDISLASDLPFDTLQTLSLPLLGLLRGILESGKSKINLLRRIAQAPQWTDRISFLFERRKAIPITVAVFIGMLLVSFVAGAFETTLMKNSLGSASKVTNEVAVVKTNLSILTQYQKERFPLLDVLLDLNNVLSNDIMLSHLRIDKKGNVFIAGKAQSYANSEQLTVEINKSPRFTGAVTQNMGMQQIEMKKGKKESVVMFNIRCKLRTKTGSRK